MKPPTPREWDKWWNEQPDGEYACSDCGKTGPKAYIQPVHPFWGGGACCTDCHNRRSHQRQAERKAQLAALPRCEYCRRRGTMRVGGGNPALLCGHHFQIASKEFHLRIGGMFWLAWEATGDDIRDVLGDLKQGA